MSKYTKALKVAVAVPLSGIVGYTYYCVKYSTDTVNPNDSNSNPNLPLLSCKQVNELTQRRVINFEKPEDPKEN